VIRLELSGFVEGDLDDIAAYIALDNPPRAVTFIQQLRATFRTIQRNPLIYQLRPDIGDDARMATMGHYVILFHVRDDAVRIERVVYGSRDLPAMLDPP
jgi:plasmid stabilization system protein ParE